MRPVRSIALLVLLVAMPGCLFTSQPVRRLPSLVTGPALTNNASSEVIPIDRRPALVDNTYLHMSKVGDTKPYDGIPDCVNHMLTQLQRAYDLGFGRLIINRPFPDTRDPLGKAAEPAPLFAEFKDLTPALQRAYRTHLRRWADQHPDFSVEFYIRVQRPSDGKRWNAASYLDQLLPWLECGGRAVWLDAMEGSQNLSLVEAMNQLPELTDPETGRRLVVGAEPVSVDRRAKRAMHQTRMPFVSAQQFGGLGAIGAPSYEFDPDVTWINYWVTRWRDNEQPAESLRFERMRANGYVPWIYAVPRSIQIPRLRRVFGFGPIDSPADWDDDGDVDRDDRSLFLQRWGSGADPTFFNGDFDLDGRVTQADRDAFEAQWRAAAGGARVPRVDLGRQPSPAAWGRYRPAR
ncbi:MAG: hypothetical protein AAGI17_07285 [Planctomycetota bacterium]